MAQSRPLGILVVDDYPDSAEATVQFLALHGYDARFAHSCAEAVAMVNGDAAFVPDIVLLDIRLPDGDGFSLGGELCRRLPVRPVLIGLTGLPGQEDNCRAAGFNHHLLKPADPTALIELISQYKKE
jgi:two-component system CheB/CheR fusion protein